MKHSARGIAFTGIAVALAIPLTACTSPSNSGAVGQEKKPAAVAQNAPGPQEHARLLMEQAMPRTAIAYNAADFDKFAGAYEFPNGAAYMTVRREGDHFFTRVTGQQDVEVFPESPTKFFLKVVDAQISFDTDASGKVTELVLHQGGREQHAKRTDDAAAKAFDAAFEARFKSQTPDPAREAPLRQFIEAASRGTPDFEIMSPQLADAVRKQKPMADETFQKAGAFKSLTFKGVGPGGADIYIAAFEHANQEWRIGPLGPDGKINGIVSRPAP